MNAKSANHDLAKRVAILLMMLGSCWPAYAAQSSAQRAAAIAKLPDWSGIWEADVGFTSAPSGGYTTKEGEQKAAAVTSAPPQPPFRSDWIGSHSRPMQARGACLVGLPGSMGNPFLAFEILITPEETVLLLSSNGAVRHIYTDGRAHPGSEDLWPTPLGDSVGRWQGHTLLVDTVATTREIMGSAPAPAGGPPPSPMMVSLSEQLHFSERIRMVDGNHLVDELTMEDPVAFAQPWKQLFKYKRVTDSNRFITENCTENERNPIVNGVETAVAR
jgi:hypothetical protein